MILRRFSQALKEQNWTAIWIEFVLLQKMTLTPFGVAGAGK